MTDTVIFRQLFDQETSTYTYLLADPETKEAVLIDSVLEQVDRDLKLIQEMGLNLKYLLDTHVHADHITGAGKLRELTGAKTVLGADSGVDCADIGLKDGEKLKFGSFSIRAIATPGHTNGCTSYLVDDMVFTGDALLIRGNGRTDFQQGSAEKLFHSISQKLYKLPPETRVYPGHDYKGLSCSSIEEEMKHNARIPQGQSLEKFVDIMKNLNLANPKKIDVSVPANLTCGRVTQQA